MGQAKGRVLASGFALVGAALALELIAGCDGLVANQAPDAGPVPTPPAARDASVRDAAKPPREPFEGWGTFDEYDGCNILVPGTRKALPPPFRWAPCPVTPQTAGMVCREMVLDWESRLTEWITPGPAIRRKDGVFALMVRRHEVGTTYAMVADLDGPVHVALRENSKQCVLFPGSSDGEHYLWSVYDSMEATDSNERHNGAIGGSLADLIPTALLQFADRGRSVSAVGDLGFLEGGQTVGRRISPWNVGGRVEDLTSNALKGTPSFAGDYLLWSHEPTSASVWGRTSGANILLSTGGDWTSGVTALATDRKDMVWVEGSQLVEDGGPRIFARVALVTSPFASTASQLVRRVLRSDFAGYAWAAKTVVGCGHAARNGYLTNADGSFRIGTIVVRLADGHAWVLPSGPGLELSWQNPLAITCDEVFVTVAERRGDAGLRVNVAAVRLDSLGASLPP